MKSFKPIIVIAGPTASGKSSFAIELAKLINGSIVNFDSMQVYKDLKILTARPNNIDLDRVPHHLYGIIPGSIRCTAIYWRDLALNEINKIFNLNRVPILVGGTGLYIKTMIDGITDIPVSDPLFINKAKNKLKEVGAENFYRVVEKIDIDMVKKISIKDHQRLIRIYSVWLQTKKSLSEWQKEDSKVNKIKNKFLKVRLNPDRNFIREKIKIRFADMINNGVIEEVKNFKKYDASMPIMKAHGLRELLSYLDGKKDIEQVKEETINQTNQYAKRQDTWFRNKYESDYVIIDIESNLRQYCIDILRLYNAMYK